MIIYRSTEGRSPQHGVFQRGTFVLLAVAAMFLSGCDKPKPIRIGILHSMTGTMAISEKSVADATQLAIEELNQKGGLLGRPIEVIVADGKSDAETFAREAQRLIQQEKVVALFGCWTSASRRTVKPVVERLNHLLFYPVQYEGLESSPNIVYTGAAPNQQIIPAVKWAMDNIGTSFFLVGSDYVFPHTANAIIRDQVKALRGDIVGEEYFLLGSRDVAAVVAKIKATRPKLILNTINGDTNVEFFKALRAAGITPAEIPVMSFSVGEEELRSLGGGGTLAGNYAAWNYFQTTDTPENAAFVANYKKRYGADRVTSDPIEAGYFGVHLWAQAVTAAASADATQVRLAVRKQSFLAPEGMVYVDLDNLHTWKGGADWENPPGRTV
jgi:urea transport system substrate-binding protein